MTRNFSKIIGEWTADDSTWLFIYLFIFTAHISPPSGSTRALSLRSLSSFVSFFYFRFVRSKRSNVLLRRSVSQFIYMCVFVCAYFDLIVSPRLRNARASSSNPFLVILPYIYVCLSFFLSPIHFLFHSRSVSFIGQFITLHSHFLCIMLLEMCAHSHSHSHLRSHAHIRTHTYMQALFCNNIVFAKHIRVIDRHWVDTLNDF